MLRGFYQYFSIAHTQRKLDWVRHEVQLQWVRALRRQGQRSKVSWVSICTSPWFKLPAISGTVHPAV